MTKELFLEWLKDTAIKTVKTMAQAAIGAIGASAAIKDVDWALVGGTVALSGVMCILMALTNLKTSKETAAELPESSTESAEVEQASDTSETKEIEESSETAEEKIATEEQAGE